MSPPAPKAPASAVPTTRPAPPRPAAWAAPAAAAARAIAAFRALFMQTRGRDGRCGRGPLSLRVCVDDIRMHTPSRSATLRSTFDPIIRRSIFAHCSRRRRTTTTTRRTTTRSHGPPHDCPQHRPSGMLHATLAFVNSFRSLCVLGRGGQSFGPCNAITSGRTNSLISHVSGSPRRSQPIRPYRLAHFWYW